MSLTAVDHVQLAIPAGGEETARPFYVDVLGLTELPKPPELAARGGAWFTSGTVQVHLGVDPEFRPATKAHAAFRVSDLHEIEQRARQCGYRIGEDDPLPGFARIFVYDPFGNRIELMQKLD
ncbi:MAG TPA: VOC family protein [Alphaproteobacteria bacterium]|nr:VOC family protein [Alphaproteobacteria bacterium]